MTANCKITQVLIESLYLADFILVNNKVIIPSLLLLLLLLDIAQINVLIHDQIRITIKKKVKKKHKPSTYNKL